ncbi:hypothetical protein ACG2LH_05970 [Zhouia sp. PK063]|uniref:hypothetical protein n=1 Tax=Zhouia sp. PK063 TaxID=3373602 RepID=UPI0037A89655
MITDENMHKIFTGPSVTATAVKENLEENGINAILDDDYNSGKSPEDEAPIVENLDVFVHKDDLGKSQQLIDEMYNDLLDDNN